MQYAELHCHSAFSLLDGASNPEELAARAAEIGLAALALTDHDDLGGIVRFAQAAKEVSLEAIIGAELTLEDDSHLTLLVESREGYKNLCHLITLARATNARGKPRVPYEELLAHASGLVALSGCPHGAIPAALARGQHEEAKRRLEQMLEGFGGSFFLELWDHHITQEAIIARQLLEMSRSYAIPWVVTNNVHYATPRKRIIHDVLTCIRHEVTLATAGRRLRPNGSWYLKSPEEMTQLWQHDLEGVKNTLVIAERCRFRLGLLKPSLPVFALPPIDTTSSAEPMTAGADPAHNDISSIEPTHDDTCCCWGGSRAARSRDTSASGAEPAHDETSSHPVAGSQSGGYEDAQRAAREPPRQSAGNQQLQTTTHNGYLEKLVWEGTTKRYPNMTEKHFRQINHELSLITKLNLAPYFLIMWDIVRFAQSQGIAVQGRGSAANSAVCYCLGITAVDPVGMDLLFERFLSEGRNEPPDIDLDIAHLEREKVLQYVYDKYGRDHAAMVCEAITYRGRSAVRDAARVLGFSTEQADRLAGEGQFHEAIEAAQALALGGAARAGFDPNDRRVRLLTEVVAGLDHLPRHRSIHVGGFVLSGEPLGEFVPIEPASMAGRTVIQWDKDDIDPIGMIKIDLLGLGMLTMIQEAVKLVKRYRRLEIDLACLDMNDPAIYDMLCEADTIGIFQVESRAQMNILPKLRPRCFYDIVVSIALVRPGPIQGNIVHPYMRRRAGEEPVTYLHPTLEPILARTLGVPLFQEQGMRLAVVAAGFSPSQADQLRRVMSHKRSAEKMARLCQDLSRGMEANGFSPEAVKTITHQLQAFANYGFPESHAASFALLVYASAYLKKYFAPEFYCAMLNAQPMGFYSPATLVRDALRHGVEVRSVDLAKSRWDCTLEAGDSGNSANDDCQDPALAVDSVFQASDLKAAGRGPLPASQVPQAPPTETRKHASSPRSSAGVEPVGAPREAPAPPASLALRIGLRYVQGLGKKAREALESAWGAGGPFTSVEDVCRRSGLGWKALPVLARAGAFESLYPGRREALWEVLAQARRNRELPLFKALEQMDQKDDAMPGRDSTDSEAKDSEEESEASRLDARRASGTSPERLIKSSEEQPEACRGGSSSRPFDTRTEQGTQRTERLNKENLPPLTPLEETVADYRTLGLSAGRHPMTFYREWAATQGIISCSELPKGYNGERITVAGGVICRQRPGTAKGFVFLTLEDETGMANVVIRPQLFDSNRHVILNSDFMSITGTLQLDQGVSNLIAETVETLPFLSGNPNLPSRDFH